jgi:hypothetical protein
MVCCYDKVAYPNNLLRNVARKDVHSQFIFLVDIDTIPSQGLRSQFNSFASSFNLFEPLNARGIDLSSKSSNNY